jgi:hypothetical protein
MPDVTKLSPDDLHKFAEALKKTRTNNGAKVLAAARKTTQDMTKASKALADVAKQNPEV